MRTRMNIRKCHISLGIIIALFTTVHQPVDAQEDCDILMGAARILYEQGKWDIVKSECEAYLNQCGYNAEMQQMLDVCNILLKKAEEPEPEPAPVLVPNVVPEAEEELVLEPEPEPVYTPLPEPEPVYTPEPVDTPRGEIVFNVSRSFVEFGEAGGDAQIEVTADEAWSVQEAPAWVNATRSGNTLHIRAQRNERLTARENDIVLANAHGVEIHVVVAQERNSDYLNLSAQLVNDTEGDGGRFFIQVSSNKCWQIGTLPAWCKAETTGTALIIRLEANRTGAARQTEIELSVPYSAVPKKTILVQQAPTYNHISINPNLITSSGKRSAATVTVVSDQAYTVENLPYWCTISSQDATSFVIEIDDNSGGGTREAECQVTVAGGKSATLTIRQKERYNYVSVTPTIITASRRGGVITVRVKSSGAWRVVNLPEWCQVTDETTGTFTLNIDANDTGVPRTASFSVSSSGVRENVEIKQD